MSAHPTRSQLDDNWSTLDSSAAAALCWRVMTDNDVALWHWTIPSGEFQLSPQFIALAQLPTRQPIQRLDDFLRLVSLQHQGVLLAQVGRMLKGAHTRFECPLTLHNGRQLVFLGTFDPERKSATGLVAPALLAEPLESDNYAQLFDSLFQHSHVPKALLDARGCMMRVNPAWERMFQQIPGQFLQRHAHFNLLASPGCSLTDDEKAAIQAGLAAGQPQTFNFSFALANLLDIQPAEAPTLHLRATHAPLLDYDGQLRCVLVVYENRSEELRASNDLARNTQLLTGVLGQRSAPPVAVKDLEGNYLFANKLYQQLFMGAATKVQGLRDEHLVDAATANLLALRERQVMEQDRAITSEQSLPLFADHPARFIWSSFPVRDEHDSVFSIGHLFTEITHLHEQRLVIANQRQELQLLLDNVQDIILYLDQWGRVKHANTAASAFFKGTHLIGKTLVEVFRDCHQMAQLQREVMQVVRTNIAEVGVTEALHFGDRQYWFSLDKAPTTDTDGIVNGVLLVMRDITKEKVIEQELQDSEHRYRAFIANSMDGIWCCRIEPPIDTRLPVEEQVKQLGERAVFTECNQVMAELRDCESADALLGVPMFDHGIETHRSAMCQFVESGYRLRDINTFRERANGERIELTVSTLGILEGHALKHVWGITRDVTEKRRYLAEMEYQAQHDALTGLPNRNFLYRTLREHFSECPESQKMALLLIDLNRFKDLNDTLGHQVGDRLLKQIGPRLQEELRDVESFVARLGGDEFAVFLPQIRNEQQAVVVAHRLMEVIREPYDLKGFTSEIGAAIGISLRPQQAKDISALMRFADVAMSNAKSQYSGVAIYSPEIDPHSPKRFSLMSDLRRAIREDELMMHFQPKVELHTGRLHGFEALLRWNHPTLGFVPPGDFIPMAEATDIIHPLTEWVLEASIRQCRQWHQQRFYVSVAVNLSTRNLMDERLPKKLADLLTKNDLPASALELEITESAIMEDPERALLLLQQISDLGIKLSIDDFGTGYSSLAYLKRLPVQALKIDYSFVRLLLEDKQDEVIVRSTVNLGHNLGLHVVAEGVEDQPTLDCLIDMGCNQAQGYFLGRPMPPSAVPEWYASAPWEADVEEGDLPPDFSTDN
ncbi:EAL domain-containing protein [Simiduia aestuariiviva]|uniref:cyclic-guanylate-specific phosphodiesterase n=1 Tax=Simiduia aestuariiviva TaxID=1510459 RepID=A0A839UTQ9_9GAMM|nr:EAL domain-containing protein [Simiduia aestuariiviva]MBB3168888.1 diguanylate cyclase (GGDEF)-like protein/PAS domain S-box-containing protein [Simiduia aestuariiviva]